MSDEIRKPKTAALPTRKTPAHLPVKVIPGRAVIVYVTVCTDKRKAILGRPEAHRVLVDALNQAHLWLTGRYMVMPDHVHLFCSPRSQKAPPVKKWVQYWKALASRGWPWPQEQPIWERSCWDRQVRSAEDYAERMEYIRLNPVRKGLVADPADWPFQGELNVLRW